MWWRARSEHVFGGCEWRRFRQQRTCHGGNGRTVYNSVWGGTTHCFAFRRTIARFRWSDSEAAHAAEEAAGSRQSANGVSNHEIPGLINRLSELRCPHTESHAHRKVHCYSISRSACFAGRSIEIQQAHARRGADQQLARRLKDKAFSSDLSTQSCVP